MSLDARGELAGLLAAFNLRFPDTRLSSPISSHADQNCLVIKVDGELDSKNSFAFFDVCVAALPSAKALGSLVIDLSALGYISSTGVGAMTCLLAEAGKHEILLFLRGMHGKARDIFELLGFTSFFNCLDDAPEPA
ncbi:MAG: STAS domain-containing protein [Spirochaetota bacterium]